MKKLFILITLLLFATSSFAATYYVDGSTGNDSNNGAIGTPWLTIARAKGSNAGSPNVDPGDTVYLRDGTFTYSSGTYGVLFSSGDSGTSGNVITYIAYPSETPILHGTKAGSGNYFLINNNGADYITFDGLTLTADAGATRVTGIEIAGAGLTSSAITVQNCSFTTYSGVGSLGYAIFDNFSILNNDFFQVTGPIYLNNGTDANIRGNVFRLRSGRNETKPSCCWRIIR